MTTKTNEMIIAALKDYRLRMRDAADCAIAAGTTGCEEDAAHFRQEASDATYALAEVYKKTDLTIGRMLSEAEDVKQHLINCVNNPGANISIIVTSDDGKTTSAGLYDHAALVQSLIDALAYFQSEI